MNRLHFANMLSEREREREIMFTNNTIIELSFNVCILRNAIMQKIV